MSPILFPVWFMAQTTSRRLIEVDVTAAIRENDLVGYLCLIALAGFSIVSWAVMAFKFFHIWQAGKQTRAYLQLCADSGRLEDAFRHSSSCPDSPLAQIARETYLEVQAEEWYQSAREHGPQHRLELARIGLERVHERTISREIRHLESWLIFLSTTASVCPFIGLFGTVWGILAAFQGLATHGTATLQVIAPGVATALTTTVAGLVAAIPAVVVYNYLTNSINNLVTRMEGFALELSNVVQKRVLED